MEIQCKLKNNAKKPYLIFDECLYMSGEESMWACKYVSKYFGMLGWMRA